MRICNNNEIIIAHQALKEAIQSEYLFQLSLIDAMQDPQNHKLVKIKQLCDDSVSKCTNATIQAVFVLSQADPELLDSIIKIDGN